MIDISVSRRTETTTMVTIPGDDLDKIIAAGIYALHKTSLPANALHMLTEGRYKINYEVDPDVLPEDRVSQCELVLTEFQTERD